VHLVVATAPQAVVSDALQARDYSSVREFQLMVPLRLALQRPDKRKIAMA
jgi:hypothetical protein